jgi:hypothetical protein
MQGNRPLGHAVLPLAAAVWLSLGTVAADERLRQAGHGCLAQAKGDGVVSAFCRKGQGEAAGNVRAVLANAQRGSAERALYEACLAEWRAPAGGHDWRMVQFCLQSAARADAP